MTTIKEIYENNISEDIVSIGDTLKSELKKINRKLEGKNKSFFLVVLDYDEKITGVITRTELREMLEEAGRCSNFNIKFKNYAKEHIILEESEDAVKGLKELKKIKNKGFILVKNKEGNYIGKILLENITKT